jgi:hypothetical protein
MLWRLGRYWRTRPLVFSLVPRSQRPLCGRDVSIAPRVRAPAARVPVGERRAIGAVTVCLIAAHLAADRAAVPAEHPGHGGAAQTALPQQSQGVSFCEGDLVIRHTQASFSWSRLKPMVSPGHRFCRGWCCTYYMNARCLTSA